MGNVYRQDSQRLHELLDRSSATSGATMLIPDLQRPYVWTPNQVTLLIDSLIRGWPFGTLLLWKVNHQELEGIPYRPFWTVVNRTGDADGAQVTQMNPPAEYHMVLDGQQRVQSLLLALAGDDWGFTLEDRDWTEEIKERRPRGRQANYRHWSKASLCFDLKKFKQEYTNQGSNLLAVDFRKVLTWAITDPQGGQSAYPKPDNYEDPLPKAYLPENQKQLIRLSRLWKEAQPNPGLKEAQFRATIKPLLQQQGLSVEEIAVLLQPLGELMTTLRDVKLVDVTYLELQPYDEQTWTRDAYNDAIVSIFTRLNTAGRTLTREEITLAWLKVGWDSQLTSGKSAGECFTDLRNQLSDDGLDLDTDELVSAASFVWAVAHNEGRLLANSDLLKGAVIRPMAASLSKEWGPVQNAFVTGAKALIQRSMEYGQRGQFSSLYALAVVWAWMYIAESWKAEHHLTELARDDFDKRCNDSVASYLDRWIMCSQWAGVWSASSITTIEAYAKSLTDLQKSVASVSDYDKAHRAWDDCFAKFLDNLVKDASNYINTVSASSRERVGVYRSLLWVWHRLDTDRWAKSQTQLRVGKSKTAIEVDHTLAFGLWKGLWKGKSANAEEIDEADALALVNRLGNCALLEKNFNISKSDKGLKEFLAQIHEIKQGKIRIDAWCAALSISQPLLDPAAATVKDVIDAIENRDKEIRAELVEFVRGQRARIDVATPVGPNEGAKKAAAAVAAQSSTPSAVQPSIPCAPEPVGNSSDGHFEEEEEEEQQTEPSYGLDLSGLHAAYEEDSVVRLILDHFAGRQRNQNTTEIDSLLDALDRAGTSSEKSALIRAFRRLDALGIGRFVAGRRGYATRFEWREKSLAVRALALGGTQQRPPT
jgi:hypothetical protein